MRSIVAVGAAVLVATSISGATEHRPSGSRPGCRRPLAWSHAFAILALRARYV